MLNHMMFLITQRNNNLLHHFLNGGALEYYPDIRLVGNRVKFVVYVYAQVPNSQRAFSLNLLTKTEHMFDAPLRLINCRAMSQYVKEYFRFAIEIDQLYESSHVAVHS